MGQDDDDEDIPTRQDVSPLSPDYELAPPTVEQSVGPFIEPRDTQITRHTPTSSRRMEVSGATVPSITVPEVRRRADASIDGARTFDEVRGLDGPTSPDGFVSPYVDSSDSATTHPDVPSVQIVGSPRAEHDTTPPPAGGPPSTVSSSWGPLPQEAAPQGFGAPPSMRNPIATIVDGQIPAPVMHVKKPTPEVPSFSAPNILVSPSLEIDATALAKAEQAEQDDKKKQKRQRRAGQAPTEVLLPALKRKKQKEEKEGSDWPLIFGLLGLTLLILGLLFAVLFIFVLNVS